MYSGFGATTAGTQPTAISTTVASPSTPFVREPVTPPASTPVMLPPGGGLNLTALIQPAIDEAFSDENFKKNLGPVIDKVSTRAASAALPVIETRLKEKLKPVAIAAGAGFAGLAALIWFTRSK